MKIEKVDSMPFEARANTKWTQLYRCLSEMKVGEVIKVEINNNLPLIRSKIAYYQNKADKHFFSRSRDGWLYIERDK